MQRLPAYLVLAALVTGCNDPGSNDDDSPSDETGDGDGDSGDGDGDSGDGDGDGDSGDGDGDGDSGDGDGEPEPDPIPDGLFASVPFIGESLAMAPDHLFVTQNESFFDDTVVLRIGKADAISEPFATIDSYNDMVATDEWLVWARATDLYRTPLDSGVAPELFASVGGVGGLFQIETNGAQLYMRKFRDNDQIYRMGVGGEDLTQLTSGMISNLAVNSTRLYALDEVGLIEIDVDNGAVTPVLADVTGFSVDDSVLHVELDGALHELALDGGAPTELVDADALGNAIYFAHDAEHVYWTTSSISTENTVRRVAVGGGAVEVLATFSGNLRPIELQLDETHAYWLIREGDEPGIWRVTK